MKKWLLSFFSLGFYGGLILAVVLKRHLIPRLHIVAWVAFLLLLLLTLKSDRENGGEA